MTKPVTILLVAALLSLVTAVAGVTFGWGGGPCGSRTLEITATDSAALSATFVGDTMLGDAARPMLARLGYDWPLQGIGALLDGDVTIANAEGPITTRTEAFDRGQSWTYNAQPDAAAALRRAGIDVLNLANNHIMDRGPQGLADTIAVAGSLGLATVGAGMTACEAELPLLVHGPAGTLAIASFGNYYGRDKTASTFGAGTVALSRASIERGAALARAAGADWIVAYAHWGENYKTTNETQRTLAGYFAASGYDLVVGAHPHEIQPIDVVDGMPVAYSIGNFVFGSAGRFPEGVPGVGLMLRVEFAESGLRSLSLRCIVTDNDIVGFQPRPCDQTLATSVLTGLNPGVRVTGAVGTLLPE